MITNLVDKLLKRGLITSIYPESVEYRERARQILKGTSAVYTGFDATAPSLHVGNLATIVNSLYFQTHGHQVICVIGDATAQIGDPSGHSRDRAKLDKSVIENNAASIEETLSRIFNNFDRCFLQNNQPHSQMRVQGVEDIKKPLITRNSIWYQDQNVVDFVGDIFREVRVGWLLHKKSIQERLASTDGMNASELSYQIFQAYDWLKLYESYNCRLQIGGSDQGGNIYTGHDLIKRMRKDHDTIGLLAPLITVKGKKLGKTMEKYRSGIWLRPDQTSPFDLYQFFLRTPDDEVEKFLRVFSFYDEETIDDLIKNHLKKREDIWHCQRKLAEHACLLVHGQEGLDQARMETERAFHKIKPVDVSH